MTNFPSASYSRRSFLGKVGYTGCAVDERAVAVSSSTAHSSLTCGAGSVTRRDDDDGKLLFILAADDLTVNPFEVGRVASTAIGSSSAVARATIH